MNYVNSFNLFGTDVALKPNITGKGAPTPATEGAVGCQYMDTDTEKIYLCTAADDGVYTWVDFGGNAGGGGAAGDAVLYTKQTLTPEQQAQARENIGAVGYAYVDAEIDALNDDIEGIERDLTGVKNNIIGIEQTIEENEANIAKNSDAIDELQKAVGGGGGGGHYEIGKNKFNIATVTNGCYLPAGNTTNGTAGNASSTIAHELFKTSDWISVKGGESYIFSYTGTRYGFNIHCTDDNGVLVANALSENRDIAFTIPDGATKLRFSGRIETFDSGTLQLEQGTVVTAYEPYTETYISDVDFAGVQQYEPLLEVIDEKVLTAKYFTGKKAMFFGDSITDPDYGYHQWTLQVAENTGLTIVENFAISGSKLCHTERAEPTGEHETANKKSVVNQVQYLLNNSANYDTPDIIVIFAATNDNLATDENDMNFLESIARYDEAQFTCELAGCDLMSFSGAMRWIYERLTGLYPNVSIVYVTPLQSASDRRSYAVQKKKRDAIIEISERLAMDYIDAFRLSGIYDGYEIDEAPGKYLVDGLHPNADGIVKISKCVTNGLNNLYCKL